MTREKRHYRVPKAPRSGETIRSEFLQRVRDVTYEQARQLDAIREILPEDAGRPLEEDDDYTEGEYVEDPTLDSDVIWVETSRTTVIERVENPEDSSQYVDVKRVVTVVFSNGVQSMSLLFDGWEGVV